MVVDWFITALMMSVVEYSFGLLGALVLHYVCLREWSKRHKSIYVPFVPHLAIVSVISFLTYTSFQIPNRTIEVLEGITLFCGLFCCHLIVWGTWIISKRLVFTVKSSWVNLSFRKWVFFILAWIAVAVVMLFAFDPLGFDGYSPFQYFLIATIPIYMALAHYLYLKFIETHQTQ